MLSIAGQTAGQNWLTFFVDTHGWIRLKKLNFFKIILLNLNFLKHLFLTGNTGPFS